MEKSDPNQRHFSKKKKEEEEEEEKNGFLSTSRSLGNVETLSVVLRIWWAFSLFRYDVFPLLSFSKFHLSDFSKSLLGL